jgi:hypothetical protein
MMQGKARESIPYFEKALALQPNLPATVSYLNAAKAQADMMSASDGRAGKR